MLLTEFSRIGDLKRAFRSLLALKIHDSGHEKSHRGSKLCYRSGVETLLRTALEDLRWRQSVYRK